jgi:predicted NUDIX family NTP pyrophosphohydrolase
MHPIDPSGGASGPVARRIGERTAEYPCPMPRTSAGLLLYRFRSGEPEVLLVHPGGPFWENRDLGAWSIPKGELEPGEDALTAARREFNEETGFTAVGPATPLGQARQRSGKVVMAWAVAGDLDAEQVRSNRIAIEWPPRSGRLREFPEVDRAGWFGIEEARRRILPGQAGFLEELLRVLDREPDRAT